MDQRLAAADVALKEGRRDDAIALLIQVLTDTPDQPQHLYRVLCRQLFHAARREEGLVWTEAALRRFPKDHELWNIRGVFLRRTDRRLEAIAAFERVLKINPKELSAQINLGNVYNDIGEGAKAEAVFSKVVRQAPRDHDSQRALGRALQKQRKYDAAAARYRQALSLKRDYIDAWLDLSSLQAETGRFDEAHESLDKAIEAVPDSPRLKEAKSAMFTRAGRARAAEAYLLESATQHEAEAWYQFRLGSTVAEYDRPRGNVHMRRAVELAPTNVEYLMTLAESLNRTRAGDEAALIDEAYAYLLKAMALGPLPLEHTSRAYAILVRVCDFERLDAMGSFRDVGRYWATNDRLGALLHQMARVETPEDRLELIKQHRLWGETSDQRARAHPIRRPPPRPPGDRIRVGFMSSDLRRHPVAYFAMPVFEGLDPERFEVFCYSFYQGAEDDVQRAIAARCAAYRWKPEISNAEAAQMIADDDLDILFELGGATAMNKVDVMAYRPAPRQVSWLGYPNSIGVKEIDYLLTDPYMQPPNRRLMIEKPLTMPHTWITLGRHAFTEQNEILATSAEERNGYVTYGTANNPHKYNPLVLKTWARIVAATDNSRFAFLRPEGGSKAFRENVLRAFAAEGVSEDRVVFHAVRGVHLPFYNEIDITLDPFPLTGGTTTCEALWMGVPVVSLKGEALFERLSYSLLTNAGLGHLCADDLDGFVAAALKLAADPTQRRDLRRTLRTRLRESPLGRTEDFARDFYDLIEKTVRGDVKA